MMPHSLSGCIGKSALDCTGEVASAQTARSVTHVYRNVRVNLQVIITKLITEIS